MGLIQLEELMWMLKDNMTEVNRCNIGKSSLFRSHCLVGLIPLEEMMLPSLE